MCTLAVLFQAHAAGPLVVAANRDEWLARPAAPFQVLRREPRTLGGKDEQAGGTWLAVNEHGVMAALTNQPGGRDPARRSRGELPLLLTRERSARAAVEAFRSSARGEAWNPCWLLVGDREALYYLPIEGQGPPRVEALAPGVHVLENRPLRPASAKAARIAARAAAAAAAAGDVERLLAGLGALLGDHDAPEEPAAARPREVEATCVHAGPYGTRSAALVLVPPVGLPRVRAAEGSPCATALLDRTALWTSG